MLDRRVDEQFALAYALGWIRVAGGNSVLPIWVHDSILEVRSLLAELRERDGGQSTCIYCREQHNPEHLLARFFQKPSFRSECFRGGLSPDLKKEVQTRVIAGETLVIAATNAFGMGVDKPDIRVLIHADIPGSLENYLQEEGRAGRDGAAARCVLLFDEEDVETQFRLSATSQLTPRPPVSSRASAAARPTMPARSPRPAPILAERSMVPSHQRIYDQACCYDVAFAFRDVAAECDALTALATRHAGQAPSSVLELAAGPARHAREFARRGVAATALDAVPAMIDLALQHARRDGVALTAFCADMVDFRLERRFDLAVLLMDSASYLLDNQAMLGHLACVARHLNDGGVYVLEMSHPRDAFGVGVSSKTQWTAEADGLRVDMRWGADGDAFDPITQVDEVTVTMSWSGPEGDGQLVERARQRRFTANEFDALVRASQAFEIVEWMGSLAPPAPFSNDRAAWRMVPVLRRRALAA